MFSLLLKFIPYLPCWNMNKIIVVPNWRTTLLYVSNIIATFDVVSYAGCLWNNLSCLLKQNYESD